MRYFYCKLNVNKPRGPSELVKRPKSPNMLVVR